MNEELEWQEKRLEILSSLVCELRVQNREYFHDNTRQRIRIEQLDKFAAICHKIYIARNITFDEKSLLDALKEIDTLLRDKNEN